MRVALGDPSWPLHLLSHSGELPQRSAITTASWFSTGPCKQIAAREHNIYLFDPVLAVEVPCILAIYHYSPPIKADPASFKYSKQWNSFCFYSHKVQPQTQKVLVFIWPRRDPRMPQQFECHFIWRWGQFTITLYIFCFYVLAGRQLCFKRWGLTWKLAGMSKIMKFDFWLASLTPSVSPWHLIAEDGPACTWGSGHHHRTGSLIRHGKYKGKEIYHNRVGIVVFRPESKEILALSYLLY